MAILKEFLKSRHGRAGALMLAVMAMVSAYALMAYPLDFGQRIWNDPTAWSDNPKTAAPVWASWLLGGGSVRHVVFEASRPAREVASEGRVIRIYGFSFEHAADGFPTFLSFSVKGITYWSEPPVINVYLIRPDGKELRLYTLTVSGPFPGEDRPYRRYVDRPFRVALGGDEAAASSVAEFLRNEFGAQLDPRELLGGALERAAFGVPSDGAFRALKGRYGLVIQVLAFDERDGVDLVRFVFGGDAHGLLGTDSLGRDIAVGLLFGFPVALFIGVATASLTTAIGSILGALSGYVGGRTDTLIQRLADVLANFPILPLLIFFSFTLGQSLFLVLLLLVIFGWPGLAITVRSMVLQIRAGQLVEAAVAIGASRWRIVAKHVFPQVAPFVFGRMIFAAPAAILAEAGLSFIGLGDPKIPTWGQMLEYGFRNGAVYLGYWWWVLPPGLMILLTALSFILVALGLEPAINARMRLRLAR